VSLLYKKAYNWDYDGVYKPGGSHAFGNVHFSVGIFQWLPKTKGIGLKRGKTIQRVKGLSSNPEEVYEKAEEICKELNK